MLANHGGAVEYELQRLGVDLADMYRGRITPRKVAVLVANMPRGAATWRAVGGEMAITDETEAGFLIEWTLRQLWWVYGGKSGPAPEFRDYPALWDDSGPDPEASKREAKAAAWKARQAARDIDN